MFDLFAYQNHLRTGWLGRRFWYFQSMESTSQFLHQMPGHRLSHGLICFTDEQTKGKGQFGRSWYAEKNSGLTFTIVLTPDGKSRFQIFSLTVIIALKELIREMTKSDCVFKWPNDLLLSGKKVAGLLTETRFSGKHPDRIFLGLGVNLNQEEFPRDLRDKATSLYASYPQKKIDRALFLACLLNRLECFLDQAFYQDAALINRINRHIFGYGQWAYLSINGKQQNDPFKILGINEHGFLMVLNRNDTIQTFSHERVRIVATE